MSYCALWYQPHPFLKNTTPSFLPSSPPLNLQTVQAPLFKQSPSILVFHETSLKVRFFSEPQKYQSFSSLTSSYLLKATKFLVEISEFEFLVMTEKNIFAHKLFLPLNIQILIFWFIFIWKLHPPPLPHPNKVTPLFPSKSPLKVEVLSNPSPFWKSGWSFTPLPSRKGAVHTTTV